MLKKELGSLLMDCVVSLCSTPKIQIWIIFGRKRTIKFLKSKWLKNTCIIKRLAISGKICSKLALGVEERRKSAGRGWIQTFCPEIHGGSQECSQGPETSGPHEWGGLCPLWQEAPDLGWIGPVYTFVGCPQWSEYP